MEVTKGWQQTGASGVDVPQWGGGGEDTKAATCLVVHVQILTRVFAPLPPDWYSLK